LGALTPAVGDHLQQILHETFEVWSEGLDFASYARYWDAQLRTSWGRAHLDRVALVEGGRVTSSAKRYDLSARIDGRIRRVLGIGAVFTSPDRRGRGGARRLLEMAIETAEAEGYEFALLFSEIGPSFYESLDFVPIPTLESRLDVVRQAGAPAVLLRAGDDRDLPAIAEMGSLRASTIARFALDRSEDWIAFAIAKRRLLSGLGPPGLREVEFLVVEEGHRAVAYLVSTVQDGQWVIEEAGDRDPSGARVGAMLQVMLARTPHLPSPIIRARLPHAFHPPQVSIADTRPTADVMMMRPLTDRTLPLPPLDAGQVLYWAGDVF
jgi:GNAT superfamily N-acetyltransferase